MIKDIIQTIGVRYAVAFLNLLLIVINSKVLGREGIGLAGIIFTLANLVVIFNSIFCSNTIVYFMNRYNLRSVFYPAYIWVFVGSAIACATMYFFHLLPEGYELTIFGLATLISLVTANSLMLLGKDNVRDFNLTFLFQGTLLFLLLTGIYYIIDYKEVKGYFAGLFTAYLTAYLYSAIRLLPYLSKKKDIAVNQSFTTVLKEMFLYGIWSSADNLAEGLTTRLNYFFVQNIGGYGQVGLLDSGTKLSESVWHISNSVSYIEYNSVSKTTDKQEQKRVTLRLFKLTYCALFIVMSIVVCLPEWVYTDYLLTSEFVGIRKIITGLSFGIVAFGSNRILGHYFIGSGNVKYSAFCSLLGLFVLFVVGFILIPIYGVFGAAVTCSITYICMLLFSMAVFMKQTNAALVELLPAKEDWDELMKKARHLLKRKQERR